MWHTPILAKGAGGDLPNWDRCICADCWKTYGPDRRRSIARHRIERAAYAGCDEAIDMINTFISLGHPVDLSLNFSWTLKILDECGVLAWFGGRATYDPERIVA